MPRLLWVQFDLSLRHRYVTEEDLEVFKHRIERGGTLPGAGAWEPMMSKDFGGFTYEAWRRKLPV